MKDLPGNVQYFIIGGGEERVSLEKLIKSLNLEKRIHLLGPILNANKILSKFGLECKMAFQIDVLDSFEKKSSEQKQSLK